MSLPEGPQRPEVTIGSRAGDHLTIRSVARAPRPSEPGWFRVEVEISADPFSGRYEAFWYAEFIRRFVAELSSAYERLGGTTELKPAWEDSLWLRFKIDGAGHVRVDAIAQPRIGDPRHPELRFAIDGLDQSYLPEIIAGFEVLAAT